jgi:uncharacterized tellurite resistance protein B-like protein
VLDKLRDFFAAPTETVADDDAALHLAAAVLLVEVAKSDHRLEDLELARIERVLRQQWDIDQDDLNDLIKVAEETAEAHVSLHEHVDRVNGNFSAEQKRALIKGLWDVACADGEIHHYEELLVRRIADLIYVPHAEFIRTKHEALGGS